MLNTMWPTQEEISIKEELKDDVLSNPGSPFQSSSLGHTPSSPYRSISVSEYHRLSPPESSNHYYFGTDADSNHLQTLLPLPPFPNFQPESPSKTSVSLGRPNHLHIGDQLFRRFTVAQFGVAKCGFKSGCHSQRVKWEQEKEQFWKQRKFGKFGVLWLRKWSIAFENSSTTTGLTRGATSSEKSR